MVLRTELSLLDRIPLLDIFGLGEGCILVICVSLPTLGPLFRLVRGRVRTFSGSGSGSGIRNTSEGRGSSAAHRGLSSTSGRWDKLRGNRLNDEERTFSHTGESIDDISLVHHGAVQIQKTLEFEVIPTSKGDRQTKLNENRPT